MMDLSEGVVSYFLLNLQYFFSSIVLKLEQNVLQDERKKKSYTISQEQTKCEHLSLLHKRITFDLIISKLVPPFCTT